MLQDGPAGVFIRRVVTSAGNRERYAKRVTINARPMSQDECNGWAAKTMQRVRTLDINEITFRICNPPVQLEPRAPMMTSHSIRAALEATMEANDELTWNLTHTSRGDIRLSISGSR